jgi:hypothetical protein
LWGGDEEYSSSSPHDGVGSLLLFLKPPSIMGRMSRNMMRTPLRGGEEK